MTALSLLIVVPLVFLAGALFDPGHAHRTAYAFGIAVATIAYVVDDLLTRRTA